MSQAARNCGARPGPFSVPIISRPDAGLLARSGGLRRIASRTPLKAIGDGLDPRQRSRDTVVRLGAGGAERATHEIGHRIGGLTDVEIAFVAQECPHAMLDP